MLDSQDIQKLVEVLATKEDVHSVEKRLDGLDGRLVNVEVHLSTLSQSITSIDDRMNVLEAKQDQIISILDKMVGRMEALNQEYLVLKDRDSRYERWFLQIAEKIGVTLIP